MSREKVNLYIINTARKHFRNTWVHRIPLTSWIYQRLFLSTYKKTPEKEIVFRGNKVIVPTKDTTVVPSMISGEYESFELDLFKELVKKDMVLLDIGANIGVYSLEASKKIGNKGKIYAFEPVPENQEVLKRNLALNNINNVDVVPMGIGNKKTKLKLYLAKNSIGTHTAGKISDEYIEVEQTTINSFVATNKLKIDLIKMDIEGYEGFAIEGAKKILKEQQPLLFIEFSSHHLLQCGYDPLKHAENLMDIYSFCYAIDERTKKVNKVSDPIKLAKLYNGNLILSSDRLNFNF